MVVGLRMQLPKAAAHVRHVYAVSDLHTDYASNMDWVSALSDCEYQQDVLICAGDVCDRLDTFRQTMELLVSKFLVVFYTPGNHELWVKRDGSEGEDSLQKLLRLESVCRSLGVITSPQRVRLTSGGALRICPLLSFHHTSFDTEPEVLSLRLPPVQNGVHAGLSFRTCQCPCAMCRS